MSANQRLMLAVALSVIFFVGYTAIFPPVPPETLDAQTSQSVQLKDDTTQTTTQERVETAAGHTISDQDKIAATASSNIVTVTNKDFILKIDTLGRISSKELLQEKFNDKEGNPYILEVTGESNENSENQIVIPAGNSQIDFAGAVREVTKVDSFTW